MILPLSNVWKIDGHSIPEPQIFEVGMEDLETSAERTSNGIAHRKRARQGVRSTTYGYEWIEQEQLSYVLNLLKPEWIMFQYPDPETGITIKECYSSKKSAALYLYSKEEGKTIWKNATWNIIER